MVGHTHFLSGKDKSDYTFNHTSFPSVKAIAYQVLYKFHIKSSQKHHYLFYKFIKLKYLLILKLFLIDMNTNHYPNALRG